MSSQYKCIELETIINQVEFTLCLSGSCFSTPVWKYSQHKKRLPSIVNMPTMVWTKNSPFKPVLQIKRIPTTAKFVLLWSKFCSDPFSSNTPVTEISELISTIEKKKYA